MRLKLLTQCYEVMRAVGLVTTKAEFSTLWLGCKPSYLTAMIAKDRIPSSSVLGHFAGRLLATAAIYGAVRRSRHADLFRERHNALLEVLTEVECLRVWEMLDQAFAES